MSLQNILRNNITPLQKMQTAATVGAISGVGIFAVSKTFTSSSEVLKSREQKSYQTNGKKKITTTCNDFDWQRYRPLAV